MMSKKMKRVAFESSSYGVYEDPKARLKHQGLFQDYQELQKETDRIRHKLEDTKLRKLRLLAEVRFLRQRHKHLLELRSLSHPQGKALVSSPDTKTYPKNRSLSHVISKKGVKLNKLPHLPVPKQNGRIQVASKKTPDTRLYHKNKLASGKDSFLHDSIYLNSPARVYNGKEVPARRGLKGGPGFDLKQNERIFIANNAVFESRPAFDLNEDTGHSGKEAALPTRAPVFDLNEISMGEEEPQQVNFERVKLEDPKRSLIRNLSDDQHNDLKLLGCRNIGEGTSRVEKRKISWQDPVALRV